MKNEDFKKLIEQSEVKTRTDFTVNVMNRIKASEQKKYRIASWSSWKIIVGFVLIWIMMIFFGSAIMRVGIFEGNLLFPLLLSFVLLFLLNHLLVLHKCSAKAVNREKDLV